MTVKNRQERDRLVTSACNEGRFSRSQMGRYLAMYDRDPAGTRVLLTADEKDGGLAKGLSRSAGEDVDAASTGLSSNDDALLQASRAKMGGDLAAASDIMAAKYDPAAAAASLSAEGVPTTLDSSSEPTVGPSGITVDGNGGMSYEGLPVSIAGDGTPRVHVSSGAVSIETLKSLGLDLEYERVLAGSRAQMGYR